MRLAPLLATVAVAALCAAVYGFNLYANRIYGTEVSLIVLAEYAEPWRSAVFVAMLCGLVFGAARAARKPTKGRAQLTWLLLTFLAFPVGSELAASAIYNVGSGELEAWTGFYPRQRLRLKEPADGPCSRVDVSGWFVWWIDGQRFLPRLLPLPLRADELLKWLRQSKPENCR